MEKRGVGGEGYVGVAEMEVGKAERKVDETR